jgi:DNA repair protein RecN (Recombination protein N)
MEISRCATARLAVVLVELLVENFAVIERVRVRFHAGFNVLTGETGSGKSMVVDALALLFGGRASADMVRSDAGRARIAGIFEVPDTPHVRKLLDEAGLEIEDNELLLEREILASGKSRAFAASRPVTAALLRELAPHLGDIHGQHDQQLLFSAEAQRAMLDAFGGIYTSKLATLYRDWRRCSTELEEFGRNEQERLRLADLWSFQRKEIEAAALKAGEDAELENERRVLKNVARIEENANAAYAALYDSPQSVFAQLKIASRKLEELARIDESLTPLIEILKPAAISVDDVSYTLRDYLGKLEADPGRLEEVETRLANIERLRRKYGGSIDEILAFLAEVQAHLDGVDHASDRRAALERERAHLASDYESQATAITSARKKAAAELAKRVEIELAALAMKGTVLRIAVEPAAWSESGADSVAFLISPNAGEEPRPLEKVASGGELSRIALALKTCTSPAQKVRSLPRTLVFDEVDAGVGGGAAEAVGRRLKKLASANQVLCVTHLAQIAGFADHHYSVEKHESNGRTVSAIEELPPDARTKEIGRMLSGTLLTPEALKHAEQLIQTAKS